MHWLIFRTIHLVLIFGLSHIIYKLALPKDNFIEAFFNYNISIKEKNIRKKNWYINHILFLAICFCLSYLIETGLNLFLLIKLIGENSM